MLKDNTGYLIRMQPPNAKCLVMISIVYSLMMTLLAFILTVEDDKFAQSIWSAPLALADLFLRLRSSFLDLSSFNAVISQFEALIGILT